MRIDLHTHSRVSDGTDSPTELMHKARAAGLDVIALCDHDTFAGLGEAKHAAADAGVEFVPGIEISCMYLGVSVHLLGYGVGAHAGLEAELEQVRRSRSERLPRMLANLEAAGLPVTMAEVLAVSRDTPAIGRPHVADAMVARGYVATRDEAFSHWLAEGRPVYVGRYGMDLETGIRYVKQAGGAAVIAHPWSRQSKAVLTAGVLEEFAGIGLDGVEVDHPDHSVEVRQQLRPIAIKAGLLMTGSSDHHGLGKLHNDLGCETTDPRTFALLRTRFDADRAVLG